MNNLPIIYYFTAFVLAIFLLTCWALLRYWANSRRLPIDWREEFIIFLNERDLFWLYKDQLPNPNDCEPNDDDPCYLMKRLIIYNKHSKVCARINQEWMERVEEIRKEENK